MVLQLLMEEIRLKHMGRIKPCQEWDKTTNLNWTARRFGWSCLRSAIHNSPSKHELSGTFHGSICGEFHDFIPWNEILESLVASASPKIQLQLPKVGGMYGKVLYFTWSQWISSGHIPNSLNYSQQQLRFLVKIISKNFNANHNLPESVSHFESFRKK